FVLGGVAAMMAGVFTNPIEVVKTRMQLQGELAARGTHAKPYKNVFQAFVAVVRNDGVAGLQKGIAPALCFQFVINSCRLGIFKVALDNGWVSKNKEEVSFVRGMFWGATGGSVGALLANPFFLAQLQAQSAGKITVGYQHQHTSMFDAIRNICKVGGIAGLWRGSSANLVRASVASSVQMATFGWVKSPLRNMGFNPLAVSFLSGLSAGSLLSCVVTPLDLITIRLYNQGLDAQGKGILYKGWFDCVFKVMKTEGIYGFYKGFGPIYARSAPHSTLMLFFFDQL
ncbi:hypothetical protein KR026_007476, partial [Drosophila bipectinata]